MGGLGFVHAATVGMKIQLVPFRQEPGENMLPLDKWFADLHFA